MAAFAALGAGIGTYEVEKRVLGATPAEAGFDGALAGILSLVGAAGSIVGQGLKAGGAKIGAAVGLFNFDLGILGNAFGGCD